MSTAERLGALPRHALVELVMRLAGERNAARAERDLFEERLEKSRALVAACSLDAETVLANLPIDPDAQAHRERLDYEVGEFQRSSPVASWGATA